MKIISILGTGTDVGKTLVTAALYGFFSEEGAKIATQKWVSSGDENNYSGDLFFALQCPLRKKSDNLFKNLPVEKIQDKYKNDLPYMNLYSFAYPASPHLVSLQEKRKISKIKILHSIEYFKKQKLDYLIIEGVGGVMTPLTDTLLYVDLIEEFKFPSLLVVNNILGAINTSLLTIAELKKRKIPILGFVFNDYFKNSNLIREDNKRIIQKITGIKHAVSFSKIQKKQDFSKLGQVIAEQVIRE